MKRSQDGGGDLSKKKKTQHLDAFIFGVKFQKPGNNVVRCWSVVHRCENIHQRAVNNNSFFINMHC